MTIGLYSKEEAVESERQLRQGIVRNWSREHPDEAAWLEEHQDELPPDLSPDVAFADTAERLREELLLRAEKSARQLAEAYELRSHHAAVVELMQLCGCEKPEEAVALLRRSAIAPATMSLVTTAVVAPQGLS